MRHDDLIKQARNLLTFLDPIEALDVMTDDYDVAPSEAWLAINAALLLDERDVA